MHTFGSNTLMKENNYINNNNSLSVLAKEERETMRSATEGFWARLRYHVCAASKILYCTVRQ